MHFRLLFPVLATIFRLLVSFAVAWGHNYSSSSRLAVIEKSWSFDSECRNSRDKKK